MGQADHGPNGNRVGEVQEALVDADDRASAIVVETGGFPDIGDDAFRVLWREVDLTPGRHGVRIPIGKSLGMLVGRDVTWRAAFTGTLATASAGSRAWVTTACSTPGSRQRRGA